MGKSLYSLLNFSAGEWSGLLDARADQPKYGSAQRQCQNLIPYKTGGLTRRPGTIFIAECKFQDTDVRQYATRLISFQFSPTTSYILEFGHEYIRFYSNQQQVTKSLSDTAAWVSLTPYVIGDFVKDGGIIYYCIADVTSATAPASDPTHWAVQSIYEVPTPYSGRSLYGPSLFSLDVWTLVPCQINDVVYIVHPSYPPYKLTRIADTNWTFEQVNFITPALLDQNATDTTIAASATTGSVTLTASAPAWATTTSYTLGNSVLETSVIYNCIVPHYSGTFATDLAAGYWEVSTIFNSSQVGGTWQLAYLNSASFLEYAGVAATGFADGTSGTLQLIGKWTVETKGVWSSDIAVQTSVDNGTTWTTIRTLTSRSDANFSIDGTALVQTLFRFDITNSAGLVAPGATTPRVDLYSADGFRYGLVKLTAVGGPYTATATVVTPLLNTSGTVYWSEAAWSDFRGYPRAITAFQARTIYGSTSYEPQRIWGSVTNDLENFDLGDQTKDTDSFAFDLAAVGRGPIQWLIGQVDLFAGFSGAEWIINAGQGSFGGSNEPITPTRINAGEHSSWGSADGIPPAVVGNAVIYPQRSAKTIQQMLFSVYTNKYMSSDLTTLSQHLFGAGVIQLAYQPQFRNQGILWATTKTGSLCGMTYQLEQEVFGWHRHITGYDPATNVSQSFESVACILGQNTQDDEVWVVVDRGSRMIELINPDNWETAGTPLLGVAQPNLPDAIYVDSCVTYTSPSTSTLSGLDHLEGLSVIGNINGNRAIAPLTVSGGSITVPNYTPVAGDIVHIGLPIYYIGQTMRIDQDARAGLTQALKKQISDVYVRVMNSMSGKISNGTTTYAQWVSGFSYAAGSKVLSPLTQGAFTALVATSGIVDPSQDPLNWASCELPSYQQPVPIPYTRNPSDPFALPQMVVLPQDIRVTPQLMPFPDNDPQFQIIGNDPFPLTLLAIVLKYDVISNP